MNEKQWEIFMDYLTRYLVLLEEIATNTRPEEIAESSPAVKGFNVEGKSK